MQKWDRELNSPSIILSKINPNLETKDKMCENGAWALNAKYPLSSLNPEY